MQARKNRLSFWFALFGEGKVEVEVSNGKWDQMADLHVHSVNDCLRFGLGLGRCCDVGILVVVSIDICPRLTLKISIMTALALVKWSIGGDCVRH